MGYGIYIIINSLLIKMNLVVVPSFIPGWATLACGILFFMGIQFIFLGVIGEYVGRIFMEVKRRPLYIIEEKIGFDD
jgi:glycosyltransferase involved in cell wall biosynthesis